MSAIFAEAGLMKNLHQSSGECHPNLNSSPEEGLEFGIRYYNFIVPK